MSGNSIEAVRAKLAAASGAKLKRLVDTLEDDPRIGVQGLLQRARERIDVECRESARLNKLYALERELVAQGALRVAGLDEVGRGALAGPLTCAAVILPQRPHIEGLDDSKKLAPSRRQDVARRVHEHAVAVAVVHVQPGRIDALGMTKALAGAMTDALELLGGAEHALLDGLPLGLPCERAVVGGDSKVAAIAAASVVAKVARDALMVELAEMHPGYGLSVNKGYGTAEHLEALDRLGPSPIHRRSFSPCSNMRLF